MDESPPFLWQHMMMMMMIDDDVGHTFFVTVVYCVYRPTYVCVCVRARRLARHLLRRLGLRILRRMDFLFCGLNAMARPRKLIDLADDFFYATLPSAFSSSLVELDLAGHFLCIGAQVPAECSSLCEL